MLFATVGLSYQGYAQKLGHRMRAQEGGIVLVVIMQVQCIKDGKNVFLTGCAGTGKSATVSAIFEQLHLKYGKDFRNRVAVTAMTGIAATLVSGNDTLACVLVLATLGFRKPRSRSHNSGRVRARARARFCYLQFEKKM